MNAEAVERYYRNSGAVPFLGTLLMVGCGAAVAAVLSLVYALIDFYNPLIYFTFLATIGFGIGVGMAVTFGATLGKVRNRIYTRIVGIAVGLLALYLMWIWYTWIATEYDLLTANPLALKFIMQLIAVEGIWEIRGFAPNGLVLYGIWAIEAAMILGFAVVTSVGNDAPFCEPCNQWTDEFNSAALLQDTEDDGLRRDLEDERYERLDELQSGEVDPESHLQLTVHTCPNCDESNYLTVKRVRLTTDKDGDVQKDESDVVKNIWIPADFVGHLKEQSAAAEAEAEQVQTAESGGGEEAASETDSEQPADSPSPS